MAKLTTAQKTWLKKHFGTRGDIKYGYTWNVSKRRWQKGKYYVKPTIPWPSVVHAPISVPKPPVKTSHPTASDVLGAGAANFTYVTQAEMQRELAGMVAMELWQYTNAEAVDGIFNNVKLMIELTEIRSNYDPNAIITTATPFIKTVRRTTNNELVIEIDGDVYGRHMLVEFFIGNTTTYITGDYA